MSVMQEETRRVMPPGPKGGAIMMLQRLLLPREARNNLIPS